MKEKNNYERAAEALPNDLDTCKSMAAEAAQRFHDAVMRGDAKAIEYQRSLFEAVVCKVNGGKTFASHAPRSGGRVSAFKEVSDYCQAEPGAAPNWGQCGEWLIEVDGMKVLVQYEAFSFTGLGHFGFLAVDAHCPFISETGYQSYFHHGDYPCGYTPDEYVKLVIADLQASRKTRLIKDEHKSYVYKNRADCPALDTAKEVTGYYEPTGQGALAL